MRFKRVKRFYPQVKSLVLIGIVVFLLVLNSHDDGIPDTLTAEQQQHVIATSLEWNSQMERVIDGINDFNARPESESECAASLVKEIELLDHIGSAFYKEPEFYVAFEMDPELVQKTVSLVEVDLPRATDEMVVEILRRRDDPDFEVDQAGYYELEKAIREMYSVGKKTNLGFATPANAFGVFSETAGS